MHLRICLLSNLKQVTNLQIIDHCAFGCADAHEDRFKVRAPSWWEDFGLDGLEIQKLAITILSQVASSSCWVQLWSFYSHTVSKKRKPIELKWWKILFLSEQSWHWSTRVQQKSEILTLSRRWSLRKDMSWMSRCWASKAHKMILKLLRVLTLAAMITRPPILMFLALESRD